MIKLDDMVIEPLEVDYRLGIEKISSKSGKPYVVTLGYYKNVESAIKAIKAYKIREGMNEDLSLDEAVKRIEEINQHFENVIKFVLNGK